MPKIQVLKMARELTQPFRPLEIAELDDAYHGFIVRYSGDYVPHTHPADEFIHILEGAITLEMEHETVELRQGEACLVPAGVRHRPRCPNRALALVFEVKGLQMQDKG